MTVRIPPAVAAAIAAQQARQQTAVGRGRAGDDDGVDSMIGRLVSTVATFAVGIAGGYLASKAWVETP